MNEFIPNPEKCKYYEDENLAAACAQTLLDSTGRNRGVRFIIIRSHLLGKEIFFPAFVGAIDEYLKDCLETQRYIQL